MVGQIESEFERIATPEIKKDYYIHFSWDVYNKDDAESQKKCVEETKRMIEKNKDKTFVFISTLSKGGNEYVKAKREAEKVVAEMAKKFVIIRLPHIVGKGLTDKFLFDDAEPYGEMELLSINDAAQSIKNILESKEKNETVSVHGNIVPAKLYKSILSYSKKCLGEFKVSDQFNTQRKMWSHVDRVNELLTKGATRPVLIEILPTNFCNAECPWCFYKDTKDGRMIKKETMLNALKDIASFGVKAINWTGGGEPTIHPNFREFTEFAHNVGLKQGLFTNAIEPGQVNPELFSWIRISETNIGFFPELNKTIPKWAKHTKVGYNINLIPEHTEAYLRKVTRMVYKSGAHYIQLRPVLTRLLKDQFAVKYPYYLKDYGRDNFKVHLSEHKFNDYLKSPQYTICLGSWFCPGIDYNGKLVVCEYWLDNPKFELGDLNKKSFIDIWQNEKSINILKNLTDLSNCQHCCRNHEVNKLLFNLRGPNEDAEFL